ncbi:MAG: hypothetical protein PWQ57_1607 [Desulfovibrionales bacterium]|jgi:hypothetical protein|nr:hypothetical protein [Desulfovibrionales bacterium]
MPIVRFLLCLALAAVMAGCASWRNPDIVDQKQADEILARDEAYCNKLANRMVPVYPGNELPSPTEDALDQVSTYETEFTENRDQYKSFDECMRDRGWVKE